MDDRQDDSVIAAAVIGEVSAEPTGARKHKRHVFHATPVRAIDELDRTAAQPATFVVSRRFAEPEVFTSKLPNICAETKRRPAEPYARPPATINNHGPGGPHAMSDQTTPDLSPDVTFAAATMRVIHNMVERIQHVQQTLPEIGSIEELRAARRQYETNYAEMNRSFAMAIDYLATPGVRLWPDNGREDCLSLSGSLHGISFGIIHRANADGTCRWSFHS